MFFKAPSKLRLLLLFWDPWRGRQVGVAQGESRAVVACTVNGPGASLGLEVSVTCG